MAATSNVEEVWADARVSTAKKAINLISDVIRLWNGLVHTNFWRSFDGARGRRRLLRGFAIVLVFIALNYRAYDGFFQDDELDNLSWAPHLMLGDYARGVFRSVVLGK